MKKDIIGNGYAEFVKEDVKVYDKDIYNLIVRHSSILDRLNPKKMFRMTMIAQGMLYPKQIEQPSKKNWKFFKDI